MIPSTSTGPRISASAAIRLHARGLGRPWRAEEMAVLLAASGYAPVNRTLVMTEVSVHHELYRKVLPGMYEAVRL